MAAHSDLKKRKRDIEEKPRRHKKIRKVQHYYSSGSDSEASSHNYEFDPVDLADSETDRAEDSQEDGEENIDDEEASSRSPKSPKKNERDHPQRSTSVSGSNENWDSESSTSFPSESNRTKVSKRNDPTVFANSISAILSSKLTSTKRADPVLARSATAAQANSEIASAKLETQAKQRVREDKKAALEKGRVKDVLLGTDAPDKLEEQAESWEKVKEMQELEKRLRKTAQRGVVKLFNAVRQAQVRAEEAAKDKGTIGRTRREEKVEEMSKKGFLELVAGGGTDKTSGKMDIEEA